MKLNDLCETCENIDINTTVYIHNKSTIEVSKIKDILGQHGNDTIKWFCIRYDEDLAICFK